MKNNKYKIVLSGEYEDITLLDNHFYILSKKDKVAILPYTIDAKGVLGEIGVIKDYNYLEIEYDYTLMIDYISQDDETNLDAANRILKNLIGVSVSDAKKWMYLGSLYNSSTSDSGIALYCVNVNDIDIKSSEILYNGENVKFDMVNCANVATSDDTFLLASFLRLWNYFYVTSIKKHTKNENYE